MPCPLKRGLTAQAVEAQWKKGVQQLRGEGEAPEKPSLAELQLDETTEKEALDWAHRRGLNCEIQIKGARFLSCSKVPIGSIHIDTVTLAFDTSDRLVAVDLFKRKISGKDAEARIKQVSEDLRKTLGKPTEALGAPTEQYLNGGSMRTAIVRYRFDNYLALLTATHLPWSGIALHEQYMSGHP